MKIDSYYDDHGTLIDDTNKQSLQKFHSELGMVVVVLSHIWGSQPKDLVIWYNLIVFL